MLSSLNHVGINIAKSKLQLVEVVKEASNYCLENVDEIIFEKEFNFNSDNSEIISILQASLNSLTERNPLKSKNISVTLPVNEFTLFEIPFDSALSPSALKEHLNWEYSILFPTHDISEKIIRSHKLYSNDKQSRILVIAVSKLLIELIFNFATENNLNLKFVDISHFASDALINFSNNKTLSIYIDDSHFSISSYINKQLKTIKVFEEIEETSIITSIESFMEVENIAYDNIFIAGSSEVDEQKIAIESKLDLTLEMFNPFKKIETSESFIQNAYYMNRPNSFSASAGIGFRRI
jgi:Tfp pilus assembly PilM family ATPase